MPRAGSLLSVILLFHLSVGIVPVQAAEDVSVVQLVRESEHAMAGTRLEEALSLAHRATETDPAWAPAWRQYGLALLRKARPAEAIPAFRRALELAEDDPAARRGLAQALWHSEQPDEALEVLNEYLRREPRDETAWRDLATWLIRTDRDEQAVPALERALELDPAAVSAWRELGLLHIRQNRREEAVTALERSLRLQPDHAAVLRDLGWALWTLERRDEAVARLEAAIELGVADTERVVRQVVARLVEEDAAVEALAFYRRTQPGVPLSDVAFDLAQRGRLLASEPLLAAAWEEDGQPVLIGLYLAYVHAVNGRFDNLAQYLGPFVETADSATGEQYLELALETLHLAYFIPEAPDLIVRLEGVAGDRPALDARITGVMEKTAEEQRLRGAHQEAFHLYRRVMARDPDRTSWVMAYRLSDAMETDDATDEWLAALATRVSSPAVQAGIDGIRADRAGESQRAVTRLRESITLEPEQPVLRTILFNVHRKLGQTVAARREIQWFTQRVEEGESELRSYPAELFTRLGDFEEALAHWRLLQREAPEQLVYGIETAYALFRLGRPEEALTLLRTASARHPSQRIYELMTDIETARGNPEQAIALAEEGLRADPSRALLRYHAENSEQLANYSNALVSAERYLAEDPGYAPMALLRGRALAALERDDEARVHYRTLLERNPLQLTALSALREDAVRHQRFKEAVDLAYRRTLLQPDSPEARRQYAHALAQDGRFREALRVLRSFAMQHTLDDAVPVLVYRMISSQPYAGRNSVRQIAEHIEALAGQGYHFINTHRADDESAGAKRVMIVLLDPDMQVVKDLDPVLEAFDARVLYAGNTALPPRSPPGLPVPDVLQPLFATDRWRPASSGPGTLERAPIHAEGMRGNPLIHPVWKDAGEPERVMEFTNRIDRVLDHAARPLADESERFLVYPGGDFGQHALDANIPAAGRSDPVSAAFGALNPLYEATDRHFTHAVSFDDSGFRMPNTDSLRIPARTVPPQWDAERLMYHLSEDHPLARAQLELARILYWHGQYESAIRVLAWAADSGADPTEVAFTWGLAAGLQGDIPTAMSKLREARTLAPDDQRIEQAADRIADRIRPRLEGFLRGWEDNEDRSYLQGGLSGEFFPYERAVLGVALDRNRWKTSDQAREHGTRLGLSGRLYAVPQIWLDGRIWHLAMDDLSDRWGGHAAVRVPNPLWNGYFEAGARREEIEAVEALRADIDARIYSVRSYTRLFDVFDLFADLSRNERTDRNDTDMFEGRLLYRLREWPYAGLGWRFRVADSDINPPEYWAPEELQQHQVHASLRGNWQQFRGSLSGDVGYARERAEDWRFVWGTRAELEWRLNRHLSLYGDVSWAESATYERLNARAGISGRF